MTTIKNNMEQNRLRVAITGASGLVGTRIIDLLSADFDFVPIPQELIDITNREATQNALKNTSYDLLLHLAAYTDVDKAEYEPEKAEAVNITGTRNVFEASQEMEKPFVYISTDFVFSGNNPPYTESSMPEPISVYGKSKYEGERIVQGKGMIVRFAYPYRAHCTTKKDFAARILELLRSGTEIKMVEDASMTPTFIDDIAYSLKHLFTHYSSEVFHIVGSDSLSPYEAAKTIARVFGIAGARIIPTSYSMFFKGKALRPQYATLVSAKNSFHPMISFAQGLK